MSNNTFDPKAYWRATLRLLLVTLVIWFIVSFGAAILFRDSLDAIHLGGYPLGFWFAQQGSIFVFVGLIFWYARRMDKIDREHDVHEE
jgi:putative solute:sodium symporter small subunit